MCDLRYYLELVQVAHYWVLCLQRIFLTPKFGKIVHFMIQAPNFAHRLFSPYRNIFSAWPPGSRPFFMIEATLQEDCLWQVKFAIHIVILSYIKTQAYKCSRIHIIFYAYLENSLKSQTKKEQGTGIRRKVVASDMTPKPWNNFLRVNENKTELFSFLAEPIASFHPSKLVCVTQGESVICYSNIDWSGLCPCNHEQADTRIFVHVKHAAVHGLKTSLVSSTDTYVVV